MPCTPPPRAGLDGVALGRRPPPGQRWCDPRPPHARRAAGRSSGAPPPSARADAAKGAGASGRRAAWAGPAGTRPGPLRGSPPGTGHPAPARTPRGPPAPAASRPAAPPFRPRVGRSRGFCLSPSRPTGARADRRRPPSRDRCPGWRRALPPAPAGRSGDVPCGRCRTEAGGRIVPAGAPGRTSRAARPVIRRLPWGGRGRTDVTWFIRAALGIAARRSRRDGRPTAAAETARAPLSRPWRKGTAAAGAGTIGAGDTTADGPNRKGDSTTWKAYGLRPNWWTASITR